MRWKVRFRLLKNVLQTGQEPRDFQLEGDDYTIQEKAPDSLGGYEITWEPNDEDEGRFFFSV